MTEKVSIIKIGKIVGNCYDDFADVWVGYNPDLDKIDVICFTNNSLVSKSIDNLKIKIGVNISKEYGTRFVNEFCNIFITTYL